MTTKIEQLIEKRERRICTEWQNAFVQEFINDLQSLQPTEREVEIKKQYDDWEVHPKQLCGCWAEVAPRYKFCCKCWAKIKRVD